MNSDDDDYYSTSSSLRRGAKKYLDLVEFCRAEFEESLLLAAADQPVSKQQRSNSNERLARYRDKIGESRIVDFDVLTNFQVKSHTDFGEIQECLLLLDQIDRLNRYTSHLPLDKLFKHIGNPGAYNFALLNTKKKLIVDTHVHKILKSHRQINWSPTLNKLYPIKTIGDGNCLCHAVLSYLVGFQDVNLVLREALRTYMNDLDCNKALKKRWLRYRKTCDAGNNIQTEEKQLDQEWSEISGLKSSERQADKENESAAKTATLALIFLEDIHIFALANLFKRPVIVLSLETYKNIQPIQLRGIYLPLLSRPQDCFREPIVIAFHNFHFMPLLYALDEQEMGSSALSEKQFHLDNVDKIDAEKLTSIEYEYKNNFEAEQRERRKSSNEIGVNKMATRQGATVKRLLNYLPIQYLSGEKMEVHFLEQDEDKLEDKLLEQYLNLKEVVLEIDQLELEPDQLPYLNRHPSQKEVKLVCCTLTSERKTSPGDGISTYIEFLNESIYKHSTGASSGGARTNAEFAPIPTSDLYGAKKSSPIRPLPPVTRKLCALSNCTNDALDPSNPMFKGLCLECYEELVQSRKENEDAKGQSRSNPQTENPYCAIITCANRSLDPNKPEFKGLCKNCYRQLIQSQRANETATVTATSQSAMDGKRLTRSSESKENDYLQSPRDLYYSPDPVQSKVTLISENRARCRGSNCSRMADEGDYYCKNCRLLLQSYKSSTARNDLYSTTTTTRREIPITVLSSSSSSNHQSPSSSSTVTPRTYQIPITHQKEPLSSSVMTNQSKLYNGNLVSNPRIPVNLNSAYNTYDMYDNLGRKTTRTVPTCEVCRRVMSYDDSLYSRNACQDCFRKYGL